MNVVRRSGSITAILVAMTLGGCIQPVVPSAPPTQAIATDAAPTRTPAPTAVAVASPDPTAEPTSEPTIEPDSTPKPCPTAKVLTVVEFLRGVRRDCFGDEDIRILGWLDYPSPFGFEGPRIEPTWLAYADPSGAALWSAVPRGEFQRCPDEEPNCTFFFPRRKPSSNLTFLPFERWVILTGHLDDPAAERCHYVYPDDWEGEPLDDDDAVESCRHGFVVTAIKDVD